MSVVNTPPFGLQDLLGAKNFGRNPNELVENISPSLDQWPFLGYSFIRAARNSGSVLGRGVGATVEIPEGEVWVPIVASAFNAAPAADTYIVALTMSGIPGFSPGQDIGLAVTTDSFGVSIGEIFRASWAPPFHVALPPGIQFNAAIDAGSGTSNPSVEVLYYRLKI